MEGVCVGLDFLSICKCMFCLSDLNENALSVIAHRSWDSIVDKGLITECVENEEESSHQVDQFLVLKDLLKLLFIKGG